MQQFSQVADVMQQFFEINFHVFDQGFWGVWRNQRDQMSGSRVAGGGSGVGQEGLGPGFGPGLGWVPGEWDRGQWGRGMPGPVSWLRFLMS